jgi:hypothetical protein
MGDELMGRVKIPYYWVKKNGYGYWTPRRDMIAKGFTNVACGKDGLKHGRSQSNGMIAG